MLAHRDQENLVHGHQMAAASKPLNQGVKALNPKTPGVKAPKTPFKVPLNDENDANAFAGKSGLKVAGKGNATVGKKSVLADKNNFVTPMGPRNRAPLGQKTTNAKAAALQTPGLARDNDLGKSKQKSASVRKPKPLVSHMEATKIDVLADQPLEEREIEYMPPKPQDLPDIPSDDEFNNLNLDVLKTGGKVEDFIQRAYNEPEADGISYNERKAMHEKALDDKLGALHNARINRDMDLAEQSTCTHNPECHGDKCKDEPERKRIIEQEYKKKEAAIEQEFVEKTRSKWTRLPEGPSAATSKKAASTLSMLKTNAVKKTTPVTTVKPARFPASLVSGRKALAPVNPDPKRHASAVRASNTTLNYSKGRAASATLRKTVLPGKGVQSTRQPSQPQRVSIAEDTKHRETTTAGQDTYARYRSQGCFGDEDVETLEDDWSKQIDEIVRADAEEEFQLTF